MNDENNSNAVSASHLEQNISHEAEGQDETKAFDAPVSIHIHSVRRRLTDADGLCAKWVIDELVLSGLLVDDSPAYVKEVTYSQEKGQPEETIITITDEFIKCVDN